jgi:16S rRNA (guanine1207-N2)-methyltransferase
MTPRRPAQTAPGDYASPVRLTFHLNGQEITVYSKPGLPDWRQLTPATALLAEHALVPPDARVLLLGSRNGAAAAVLARRLTSGELWIMDNSAIALSLTSATLQANRLGNARISWEIDLPQNQNSAFDAALIELPKGRQLARRWLVLAWYALRPGGALYLSGANELGIQSAIRDATGLFGPGAILDYKKGSRIARFTRPAGPSPTPDWLHENGVAPRTWFEFEAHTPLGVLSLCSLPGVFSYDRLDDATRLLLSQIQISVTEISATEISATEISATDRLLDLGCGYGILGLVAAGMGAAQVDLVDSNLLAVAAARQNIRRLGLTNARALPGDVLDPLAGQTYTRIVTNPPFHAGKGVDYQIAAAFIQQSWAALPPGGELLLVANLFIRYEKLMEGLFSQISLAAQDDRYRVLSAIK